MPYKYLKLTIKPSGSISSSGMIAFLFLTGLLFFLSPLIQTTSGHSDLMTDSQSVSSLRKINFNLTQGALEVEILCDRFSTYQKMELPEQNKIVIDFLNIYDIQARRRIGIDDFRVQAIRTGMFQPDIARVVFDLKGDFPSYRIERIEGGLRVFFPAAAPYKAVPPKKTVESKASVGKQVFLNKIDLLKTQEALEIEIHCDRYTSHRYSFQRKMDSSRPNRIILDFFNVDNIQVRQHTPVNEFGVQAVRASMYRPGVARIVLDLEEDIPDYMIERIGDGVKVVFPLSLLEPSTTAVTTTTTTTTTTLPRATSTLIPTTMRSTTSSTSTTTTFMPTTMPLTIPTTSTTTTTTTMHTTTTTTSTTVISTTTSTTSTSSTTITTSTTTTTFQPTTTTTTTSPTTTSPTTTTTTSSSTSTTTTTTTTLPPPPPPPPTTMRPSGLKSASPFLKSS